MTKVLLSVHVLAAIIFIGPVTVAVSLFPRFARAAASGDPGAREDALPVLRLLHRISTGYAVLGLLVPVFGLAVALQLDVLTDSWLIVSIALTVLAAVILAVLVLPVQQRVLDQRADGTTQAGRLSRASGVFALLWAVVVVLMIVRPGSTTGV